MNVSLDWLKEYIQLDQDPEEISEILTMIGLEVEGMEQKELVPGGLAGVVVGEVVECEKHPNADKLSLTQVNIGHADLIQVVCGAPNVARGQKVLVATVGTTLYTDDGEPWKIKKGKIRGEVSEGMICAEDELGLGGSHDGIMVLEDNAIPGKTAKDHLGLKSDIIYEIGLTPNRSDATCHIGVAKDLAAYLKINQGYDKGVKTPDVSDFKVDMKTEKIEVEVENTEACPRYSGVMISGLTVGASPQWLQDRLLSIGVRPIYNIVDVTNFILHELGQPLHAFDADKIEDGKIIVTTLPTGTSFLSLDEKQRKLSDQDLMICDGNRNGMCIGGVFGGISSGVTDQTTRIFLEAAHFDAGWIRRTSTRHLLRTDAAKVFEKGSDPNLTVFALKRAAMLIKEVAGGHIVSDIVDIYPKKIQRPEIFVRYERVNSIIGAVLTKEEIHQIIRALDMEIEPVDSTGIQVLVPTNKADVVREIDVIEEILRIYGFNKVEIKEGITSKMFFKAEKPAYAIRNRIAENLAAQGFAEMMGLSLIESKTVLEARVANEENLVFINNTSNIHLDIMRPEMMVSGLQSVVHNHYRQNIDLKTFEFGKAYQKNGEKFHEEEFLTLFISGNQNPESWMTTSKEVDFYGIKQTVVTLLTSMGMESYQTATIEDNRFSYGVKMHRGQQMIAKIGQVHSAIQNQLGLKSSVFYAEIPMKIFLTRKAKQHAISEVSKFPSMRRDLALILDQATTFEDVVKVVRKVDKKYLKDINLFDVYEEEDHLGKGKKSYALSFVFADDTRTLKDKEIDKIIQKMIFQLESQIGAQIRK